jgi:hypothetical protein
MPVQTTGQRLPVRPGTRFAAAVVTAVVLACPPASAQEGEGRAFYPGNDLWSACSVKSGVCLGFVVGVADVMGTGSAILGRRACLPSPVAGGQAQDVVKRYLERHPEARHYAAVSLAAEALEEAFPCPP